MRLPRPAVVTVDTPEYDPVTDSWDDSVIRERFYVPEVSIGKDDRNRTVLAWWENPDEAGVLRTLTIDSLDTDGIEHWGTVLAVDTTAPERHVRIRAPEPSDARMLGGARVSQPIEVVEAHINRGGGMLAGELDAAVAADNSVATLILDTGMGLYVRYSGDWQKLPEDATILDGLSVHAVSPDAVAVYDAADAAASSLSIFDLPRSVQNRYEEVDTNVADREEPLPPPAGVTAAIIPIETLDDLSNVMAIDHRPESAWYRHKRARALTSGDIDNAEARAVVAAATDYTRMYREGVDPDPTGALYRSLVAAARRTKMLDHPAVLAAIHWREWLHPRGRDGRFIHKLGLVDIFDTDIRGVGQTPRRGKVADLTPEGVRVDFIDPRSLKPTGESEIIPSNRIETFDPMGRLDAAVPTEQAREVVRKESGSLRDKVRATYKELSDRHASKAKTHSANVVTDAPLTDKDYARHVEFLDEVNKDLNESGLTLDKIFQDENKRWDDEFYDWMLDTVDEVYEKKYARKPKQRKALMTGGLGGAGKSTTIARLQAAGVLDESEWCTVNPDDMKEEMIARGMYPTIEGMSPSEMANALHEVSSELADLLNQRLMAEGHNILQDITMGGGLKKRSRGRGQGNKGHKVSDLLRDNGYETIEGVFVDIPVEVTDDEGNIVGGSVAQALGRHKGGLERFRTGVSSEGGRYVPPFIIRGNAYSPLGAKPEKATPNPLAYGVDFKKVPYADRYGVSPEQRGLAAQADDLRKAIFTSTQGNAGDVDRLFEEFEVVATEGRALEELDALRAEWDFMDPRTTGVDAATRFRSGNAYNFMRSVHDGAINGDWAMFDNTDLNNQGLLAARGKYEGVIDRMPQGRPQRTPLEEGPLVQGFRGDQDWASEVINGLSTGAYDLTSTPTSDGDDGKYRLHVYMVHSDSVEHSQWLEYDTPEERDAALEQATKVRDKGFKGRSKVAPSALREASPEIQELGNGLVDKGDTSTKEATRESREIMDNRLELVQQGNQWVLVDSVTGNPVGAPSPSRDAVAGRKTEILEFLYPQIGA